MIHLLQKGEKVYLDATGTTDPEGDSLTYNWFCYNEAGTFAISLAKTPIGIEIENHNIKKASFMFLQKEY